MIRVPGRGGAAMNAVHRPQADVDQAARDGTTPLYKACMKGHADLARLCLRHGAVANRSIRAPPGVLPTGPDWGRAPASTALEAACRHGHVDAARALLDGGADVNRVTWNPYGESALFVACDKGRVDIMRLCLEHNANVDWWTPHGVTPLFRACENGNADAVRLLLESGADGDRANQHRNGSTPLFVACENGHAFAARISRRGVAAAPRPRRGNSPWKRVATTTRPRR